MPLDRALRMNMYKLTLDPGSFVEKLEGLLKQNRLIVEQDFHLSWQ